MSHVSQRAKKVVSQFTCQQFHVLSTLKAVYRTISRSPSMYRSLNGRQRIFALISTISTADLQFMILFPIIFIAGRILIEIHASRA